MTARTWTTALTLGAAVFLAGGAARADNGRCTNPLATKIAGSCDASVHVQGCCANDRVVWCEEDGTALCFLDCSAANRQCGWEPTFETYACGPLPSEDPDGRYPRACTWTCTGSCAGKECGTDGCFGSCGTCTEGTSCRSDGTCGACQPSCAGRECGDDGCGGTCGSCPDGDACRGDGTCCVPDCEGRQCGDDACGGTCGSCSDGAGCGLDGTCHACTCSGRECGDDGCGAPCGTCPAGKGCGEDGTCVTADPGCQATGGQGCPGCACEACVCAIDDLCCSLGWDELCARRCSEDCGGSCPCVSQCGGRECGADGCGGTCGTCPGGKTCSAAGTCVECSCTGLECGDDGCGTSCGTCPGGEECFAGHCTTAGCVATAKAGCEGCACEACTCLAHPYCCTHQWDQRCADYCAGSCHQACACVPQCLGAQCGDDGCGGSCGSCASGKTCALGECVTCSPACSDRECGDDGCGGTCGTCPTGRFCSAGSCLEPYPASCLGTTEPSAMGCPASLAAEGCCDASTRVVWCQDGDLYCSECPAPSGGTATCGWGGTDNPFYRCGGDGADPSGTHPLACACMPACAGKECGDDGCGGTCGACTDDRTCQSGTCVAAMPDTPEASDVPAEGVTDVPTGDASDIASDPGTDRKGGGGGGCSVGGTLALPLGGQGLLIAGLSAVIALLRRRNPKNRGR